MSHNRRTRALAIFLCALFLFPISAAHAVSGAVSEQTVAQLPAVSAPSAPAPAVSAKAFALLEAGTGALLAAHNENERRPMASTTKVMTALVVLERQSPDTVVTVSPDAVGVEGSSVYLYAGEQITVRTLLYALLLSSANDAAAALAIHTAGSIAAFADLMNAKAAELGLADTHFCNPHGLHNEAHYTTAKDLARLAHAALSNPLFAEIAATKRYSAPQNGTDAARLFLNHNRLLRSYEGAIGVKTGFTKASGRCLISAAERNGLRLIAVTLHAPDDWRDHTALLDWGFSQYVALPTAPDALSLPIVGGTMQTVRLLPTSAPTLTLPSNHGTLRCAVIAPRFLFAPVSAGETVGRIVWYQDGAVLTEIPLVTDTAVPTPRAPTLWGRIKRFFAR